MADKILVLNGPGYRNVVEGLGRVVLGYHEFIDNPTQFKLVLFTGGEDVSPHLYGDTSPRKLCGYNIERDAKEKMVYDLALNHGILMTGICRGLQFLNVMAGGKMMHHITGHGGDMHLMETSNGNFFFVNSFHHQMIIPAPGARVVGWAHKRRSRVYFGKADERINYSGRENEVAIFPNTKAFGVQYHPEAHDKDSDAYIYYNRMISNALNLPWKKFIKAYTRGLKDVKLADVYEHDGTATGQTDLTIQKEFS